MSMPVESPCGDDGSRGASRGASFIGLFVLLAASMMVFAVLTWAFVFRRGLSGDWASMPKPPILFVNTAVLLASSFAIEVARRASKPASARSSTPGGAPARCWVSSSCSARRWPGSS